MSPSLSEAGAFLFMLFGRDCLLAGLMCHQCEHSRQEGDDIARLLVCRWFESDLGVPHL